MTIEERVEAIERRVAEIDAKVEGFCHPHLEEAPTAPSPPSEVTEATPPGQTVAEWVSGLTGSPGFVVDAGLARSTPCVKLELGDGKALVYSKGIVGALGEEQQSLYCQEGYEVREASPKQRARLVAMSEAAKLCSQEAKGADTSEHLASYFTCLGRTLRKKGVEP